MQRVAFRRENRQDPFLNLLSLYIDAQKLVDQMIGTQPRHAVCWQKIQRRLHLIKFYIDSTEIPSANQKSKSSLAKILIKYYDPSQDLFLPLHNLEMAFQKLRQ